MDISRIVGPEFGFWIVVGTGILAAICLLLAPLPYFQEWLDERRAKETGHKEFLRLSAKQKADEYNHRLAKLSRTSQRLQSREHGAIQHRRNGNDAA